MVAILGDGVGIDMCEGRTGEISLIAQNRRRIDIASLETFSVNEFGQLVILDLGVRLWRRRSPCCWHRLSYFRSCMPRKSIILVEDHADTAECLRAFLTGIGYKVYIAPDIASARALAKAVAFDVLLSDLRLPDGTGWDLMEELSAAHPVRGIAISGYNSQDDIDRSRQVGFLHHMSKPLLLDELSTALERAVAS